MTSSEAKLNYIKAWQGLPEYGLTYFLVRFRNSKRDVSRLTKNIVAVFCSHIVSCALYTLELFHLKEMIGIGSNRLIRINPKNGEVTRTYRFTTMSHWSVHWENKEVIVDFEEEKLAFKCLSADFKVFHEFIGKF